MKIITWNLNGIRACAKKGFLEFISSQDPDILCVQETKAHEDQLSLDLKQVESYKSIFSSGLRKGYSGVANFTKVRPFRVDRGLGIPRYDLEGRVLRADYGEFLLYNIYFPNGASGKKRHDFKQEFLKHLLRKLKVDLCEGREVIVVGDYNIAHKDEDVYDPNELSSESGFLPEEREWFDRFLELGFVDCFRQLHPEKENVFSWWSYQQNARIGNRGWRIDYICVTKGLAERLESCEVLMGQEGSDHCPVVATFSGL